MITSLVGGGNFNRAPGPEDKPSRRKALVCAVAATTLFGGLGLSVKEVYDTEQRACLEEHTGAAAVHAPQTHEPPPDGWGAACDRLEVLGRLANELVNELSEQIVIADAAMIPADNQTDS